MSVLFTNKKFCTANMCYTEKVSLKPNMEDLRVYLVSPLQMTPALLFSAGSVGLRLGEAVVSTVVILGAFSELT